MLSACATCGELTEGTYCESHRPKDTRGKNRRDSGYDAAWDRVSARARRLQPFCSVPGCTSMDLTADHSPEAWERKAQGKPIRLCDVEVLCRSHNSMAGAARGQRARDRDDSKGGGMTLCSRTPSPRAEAGTQSLGDTSRRIVSNREVV